MNINIKTMGGKIHKLKNTIKVNGKKVYVSVCGKKFVNVTFTGESVSCSECECSKV